MQAAAISRIDSCGGEQSSKNFKKNEHKKNKTEKFLNYENQFSNLTISKGKYRFQDIGREGQSHNGLFNQRSEK